MARTAGEVNRKKVHSYYDYSLLFLILFLVCFGLVMIYSTSSYNAQKFYGDAAYYLTRQALFAGAGILIMLFVSKIDYRLYTKKLPIIKLRPITILYFLCALLQTYVIIFGNEVKGAKRWIKLGSLGTFQPSELSKIAVILGTAFIVNLAPRKLDKIWGFLRVLLFMGPLLGLIVAENFSTGLIIGLIIVAISFVASKKKAYFIISGAALAGLASLLIIFVDFRTTRFEAWRNVETHEKGYQILQGLYAIASGGVFGKGLGESMQKLGFIPESHNDMIFSVVCEELGLFGAVTLILLFILLLWRIFIIAINAPDLYGGLIATGVLVHIASQVLINIAVVTSTIPPTGIPLPFISYGGSSLMVILFEMGIVLSISNQIKVQRSR
ncbi:FtsW/RodA/SpoVE family cell cycle protein [Herbinix luporum]|uniref:Probable peptidoglycan glycosyltransferase FtsW n=1 Tax=Herbinix luporum TaxID=1679721 RepID=A0A0K8J4E7_9FIRM|nr:putative peptidoglycan glycosyltransferase FtsW [Herbinix luporum]MDI9489302.1 putative peptidoglycan glycosyltransferase FtsW [Bacillota bacterium]CUH92367.1 putative membrane protein [Herbinix luporum]HHT58034.1 cell division protein FtsW [Herbinix luporum]